MFFVGLVFVIDGDNQGVGFSTSTPNDIIYRIVSVKRTTKNGVSYNKEVIATYINGNQTYTDILEWGEFEALMNVGDFMGKIEFIIIPKKLK